MIVHLYVCLCCHTGRVGTLSVFTHSPLSISAQHKPQCVAADGTLGWFSKPGHELMVWLPLQPHSYTGPLALSQFPFFLMHCLTPNPLPSSESKLASIRKDILSQVQNEFWSRSQQLITELSGFMEVFQTISSDFHTIAQCSQKVGLPSLLSQLRQGPTCSNAQHALLRAQLSSQWGLMLLNCVHIPALPLLIFTLFT